MHLMPESELIRSKYLSGNGSDEYVYIPDEVLLKYTTTIRVSGIKGDIDDLRREREENDFLAIAQGLGIVDNQAVEEGRELERKKERKPVSSNSKFGDWMGGLMVGTPFSNEAAEDDDDLLVQLARRVEERRNEQAAEAASAAEKEEAAFKDPLASAGAPAAAPSFGSGNTLDSTISDFFADSGTPSEATRKRRKRKDGRNAE